MAIATGLGQTWANTKPFGWHIRGMNEVMGEEKNEIGGDSSWIGQNVPVQLLQCSVCHCVLSRVKWMVEEALWGQHSVSTQWVIVVSSGFFLWGAAVTRATNVEWLIASWPVAVSATCLLQASCYDWLNATSPTCTDCYMLPVRLQSSFWSFDFAPYYLETSI